MLPLAQDGYNPLATLLYLSQELYRIILQTLFNNIRELNQQLRTAIATKTSLEKHLGIAVITVEPTGKAIFVLGCIQTRLMVNTMENDP